MSDAEKLAGETNGTFENTSPKELGTIAICADAGAPADSRSTCAGPACETSCHTKRRLPGAGRRAGVDRVGAVTPIERQASAWLEEQWRPERTLGEWWTALAESGWGARSGSRPLYIYSERAGDVTA